MQFLRLTVSSDNGFQAITDATPKALLYKDLYTPYPFKTIDSIRLDLDKGCKITDVLSVGTISLEGFPIRNKFCKLIQDLNLEDIQLVEIIDTKLNDYSFMFFNSDLTPKLDYQKSNFTLEEDILGDISDLDKGFSQQKRHDKSL